LFPLVPRTRGDKPHKPPRSKNPLASLLVRPRDSEPRSPMPACHCFPPPPLPSVACCGPMSLLVPAALPACRARSAPPKPSSFARSGNATLACRPIFACWLALSIVLPAPCSPIRHGVPHHHHHHHADNGAYIQHTAIDRTREIKHDASCSPYPRRAPSREYHAAGQLRKAPALLLERRNPPRWESHHDMYP
jgi:hypothetical protein